MTDKSRNRNDAFDAFLAMTTEELRDDEVANDAARVKWQEKYLTTKQIALAEMLAKTAQTTFGTALWRIGGGAPPASEEAKHARAFMETVTMFIITYAREMYDHAEGGAQ